MELVWRSFQRKELRERGGGQHESAVEQIEIDFNHVGLEVSFANFFCQKLFLGIIYT